jgi:hypothetical protein
MLEQAPVVGLQKRVGHSVPDTGDGVELPELRRFGLISGSRGADLAAYAFTSLKLAVYRALVSAGGPAGRNCDGEVNANGVVVASVRNFGGPDPPGSTYYLTVAGAQMGEVVRALGIWGQQWLELEREHLEPDFLMWRIYKHLPPDRLPLRRRVVRFEFRGETKRYWLVLRREDPDLCYSGPGVGDDLVIRADLEAVVRVYLGQLSLAEARRLGVLDIEGPTELMQNVTEWFRAATYDPSTRSFASVTTQSLGRLQTSQ